MSDETWADDLDPKILATARLASAALGTPKPNSRAEAESRRHVMALMEKSTLTPRRLHETAANPNADSWLTRLRRFWKR